MAVQGYCSIAARLQSKSRMSRLLTLRWPFCVTSGTASGITTDLETAMDWFWGWQSWRIQFAIHQPNHVGPASDTSGDLTESFGALAVNEKARICAHEGLVGSTDFETYDGIPGSLWQSRFLLCNPGGGETLAVTIDLPTFPQLIKESADPDFYSPMVHYSAFVFGGGIANAMSSNEAQIDYIVTNSGGTKYPFFGYFAGQPFDCWYHSSVSPPLTPTVTLTIDPLVHFLFDKQAGGDPIYNAGGTELQSPFSKLNPLE
jgi:hypothetical protein